MGDARLWLPAGRAYGGLPTALDNPGQTLLRCARTSRGMPTTSSAEASTLEAASVSTQHLPVN